ncbi:MAG: DNA replication/repair protein RecF [Streptococcaceae bacterium]|jgi:DNA replication and repair protein RecF|nr:DNA replication/repair protein RecF [Streptococcaceae bacterium]
MKITSLELTNYRNYKTAKFSFNPDLNLFLGENAQGKTNLLESIYVLALTYSHRTQKNKELICFGEKVARICGIVEKLTTKLSIEITLTTKGRKTKVNHIEQKRLADYIGRCNVILFSPEDLAMIKGSPSVRRRFLDVEISQISSIYLYDLMQYQNILKQRNSYLKQTIEQKKTDKASDKLYYEILSEQLASFGAKIIHSRLIFIEKLEKWANPLHSNISSQHEQLKLNYSSSFSLPKERSVENIEQAFIQQLKNKQKYELFVGTSSYGPHRDDLQFFINDVNIATFGSQGQQRTTALSLKLAEINLIYEKTGEYPLLLLDDVMSELDNKRQLRLLQTIFGKTQTFITTTTLKDLKQLPIKGKIFTIVEGKIEVS